MKQLGALLLLLLGISLASGGYVPPNIRETRPMVVAGELGYLQGITKPTLEGGKDIHYFRNIKFGDISGRFAQSTLNREEKGTEQTPHDASRYGPQCMQGSDDSDEIDQIMNTDIEEALVYYLEDNFGIGDMAAVPAAKVIVHMAEELFEVELTNKTVAEVAREVFDIDYSMADEECLQLAVSTPIDPTGQDLSALPVDEKLPVMLFIYGGSYSSGTMLKMDQARLGDADDFVLVTINYRLGPLGFMCLDSDKAAGNMGMLDMVVGLEWVQEYIEYFGGDPARVTVFGESAGATATGHLVLSEEARDLFAYAIGESGSALSPWAFDHHGHFHARNIAHYAGCHNATEDTDDEIADCLISIEYDKLHHAFSSYRNDLRESGTHGFQGGTPCAQTKGDRKFYTEFQRPHDIIQSGDYPDRNIMFGANSQEGDYVYGVAYKHFIRPNGYENDAHFFKYQMVKYIEESVGIDQSFDFDRQIEEFYFRPEDMGDPEKMAYGIVDMLSVDFLKASSYEMVVENSKKMPSYFYSHEHASTKSVYYAMYFNDLLPYLDDPAVCHGDELLMLFNLNVPVIFCDLNYLGAGVVKHAQICADDLGIELPELPEPGAGIGEIIEFITSVFTDVHDVAKCLVEHDSAFKVEYGECIFGSLTESELETSKRMTKAWTNFARYGNPTPDVENSILPIVQPWDRTNPEYLAFKNDETVVDVDYKLTYNKAALEHQARMDKKKAAGETTENYPPTTTPPTVSGSQGLQVSLLAAATAAALALIFG